MPVGQKLLWPTSKIRRNTWAGGRTSASWPPRRTRRGSQNRRRRARLLRRRVTMHDWSGKGGRGPGIAWSFKFSAAGPSCSYSACSCLGELLPRIALKYCGSFGSFLRSYLSKCPALRDEETHCGSLWPMPLPYPEAFQGGCREGGASWRKRRTCMQVAILCWLHLGKPPACPPRIRLGARLSSKQWRRVRMLEWLSEDSNSVFEIDAAAMARTAAKCEASSDELDALHRALAALSFAGFGLGSNAGGAINVSPFDVGEEDRYLFGEYGTEFKAGSFIAAKEIKADRIVFEGVPEFDPVPFFDEETAFAYCNPLQRSKGVVPKEAVPRVSVHAKRSERNELFRRMARTGRLVMVDREKVDETRTSGLFAVPKDLGRDRLILDSRPANAYERPLSCYTKTMASAACLGALELDEDQCLLLSGRDIKDFFYQFKVGSERCLRNTMSGSSCWPVLHLRAGGPDGRLRWPIHHGDGGFISLWICASLPYGVDPQLWRSFATGGPSTWQSLPPWRSMVGDCDRWFGVFGASSHQDGEGPQDGSFDTPGEDHAAVCRREASCEPQEVFWWWMHC